MPESLAAGVPKQLMESNMRKLASATILAGVLAALAMPVLAQTTTTPTGTPTGPQDCKATEKWDAESKTCKPG